jgi:Rad3-related DNA helicase
MGKYSLDVLDKQVGSVAIELFGPTFKFRPNQKESIVTTLYNWLNDIKDDIIISAPTGSGKSIIALLCGAVLSKYYKMKGYILCSDLGLLDQYKNDIEKCFCNWSVLKGRKEYTCFKNGLDFNAGYCQLKGVTSYKEILRVFPECKTECPYIVARNKAMASDVLVCTYAFWLIQQNIVAKTAENPPFDKRDFVICDEAHKLVNIVQDHFSPVFDVNDMKKIKTIIESANPENSDVIEELEASREKIMLYNDVNDIAYELKKYVSNLSIVNDAVDTIHRCIDVDNMSKEDKSLLYYGQYISEQYSIFKDYLAVVDSVGATVIVKNPSADEPKNIKFNCINESYLMNRFFHDNCKKKMYMSATIGSPVSYANNHAISTYEYISIPSTFKFDNSPIFYVPDYRLSYKEKDYSLPKIIDMVTSIVRMYKGRKGIIQTGSYKFSKDLYENVPKDVKRRLLLYNDSAEKGQSIDFFKYSSDDKILVGPSLIEGLNFNDDYCRFQIIMKVPYPSLSDKFISRKKDINQKWYSDETAISILQGVGRGIRHENDWCVTFILDGCFSYLAKSSSDMFPDEFKNRIQVIKSNVLIK